MIDIKIKEKVLNEKQKNEKQKYILRIIFGLLMGSVFYIGLLLGGFGYENDFLDLHKSVTFSSLKKHYLDNDLIMFDSNNELLNIDTSNKNIYIFHNHLKENYFYELGTYDCKYWSFIWGLYSLKNNLKFKFIVLDTHIFVIIEFDEKYCIADNNNLNCFYYGN